MTLKQYQKKRDFKKSPEPKGRVLKKKKSPNFVVQKHWARNLHYDFRLELDGVLKSWAVPKGPPQKVGDKRLAIQVEDHPLEYASFHGTIPEGQYGAGRVAIWDKGQVKFKRITKDLIEFDLFGKKLKGKFALLHPAKFEKKNWLFIKGT